MAIYTKYTNFQLCNLYIQEKLVRITSKLGKMLVYLFCFVHMLHDKQYFIYTYLYIEKLKFIMNAWLDDLNF